jgi:molybdopterin-guanine dinucleotide biosynthesis adapter protein
MPAIVSIVGQSNSGKTTLITRLIPELKKRGYLIGVVKHAGCEVNIDQEGKDSYRHRQAGADTVVLAANDSLSMVTNSHQNSLQSLVKYFQDVDLVITDGFKREKQLKLEAFRQELGQTPMCLDDPQLIGLITDADFDTQLTLFDINKPLPIADFIEERFLKKN